MIHLDFVASEEMFSLYLSEKKIMTKNISADIF